MWWEKSVDDMTKGLLQRKTVFRSLFKTKAVILLPALILLLFSFTDTQASWLLNPAEFHASAHGRTACTDCHYDVPDHPFIRTRRMWRIIKSNSSVGKGVWNAMMTSKNSSIMESTDLKRSKTGTNTGTV
jgi:hypothetical protein